MLLTLTEEAANAYEEAKEAYDAELRRIGKLIRKSAAAQTVNGVKRPTALKHAEALYAMETEEARRRFKRRVREILAALADGTTGPDSSDRPQT